MGRTARRGNWRQAWRRALAAAGVAGALTTLGSASQVESDDGLMLRFRDFSGEMLSCMDGNQPVPLLATEEHFDGPHPTFSLIDAGAARSKATILELKNDGGRDGPIVFRGEDAAAKVRLAVSVKSEWNDIRFDVEVEDLGGTDRALTLRHQFPIAAEGWQWWDDLAGCRTIEKGKRYIRYDKDSLGDYPVCWHPLGTVSKPGGHALTLAVPFEPGPMARIGYDGAFFIEMDLGLSAHTRTPGKATYSYFLYASDPEWGFRAAVKKYYDLFPTSFTKRVNREGSWLARTPTPWVKNPEDYLIAFHEASKVKTNSLPLDNQSGIYALIYDMPHWLGVGLPTGEEGQTGRALEEYVKKAAGDTRSPERSNAALARATAARRADGSMNIRVTTGGRTGAKSLAIEPNFDPDIPVPDGGLNRFQLWQRDELPNILRLREGRCDGQYIDSAEFEVEGMDHDPAHFATADYALLWSADQGKPGISVGVSKFEYLKKESDLLHSRGKLMMSNFTPWRLGFYVAVFDINGTEVWEHDWARIAQAAKERGEPAGDGVTPEVINDFRNRAEEIEKEPPDGFSRITDWRREDMMYYRRFCSYQKPYSLLLQDLNENNLSLFGEERFREYLEWSLFFGIYPSCTGSIWVAPKGFLDLYKRYMPVCRDLGSAGWEPVTNARSSSANIRVERFGYSLQQTLHFTARNFGEQAESFELSIDRNALNIPDGSRVEDAYTGKAIASGQTEDALRVSLELPPRRTAVIHVIAGDN